MHPHRIAVPLALAAALLAAPARPASAQGTTASKTIDVMNTLWGRHAGMRANHAKGVVAEGTFVPTAAAAALSKASIFAGKPVPVTVRFSDSTGMPTLPDGAAGANPHGMAIKFHTASGGVVDVVTNSLAFFPVATGEDFLALLSALAASTPGATKPTPADTFIAAHPTVPKAFGSVATPSSFAREAYNGVDAFVFVDRDGKRQAFRFRIDPEAGIDHLSPADAAKQPADFLIDELPKRIAKAPVRFRLRAQLAEPGDQTKDPSQPWPADRKMVDLGTIILTSMPADQAATQRALRYLPNVLEPGIEVSDDPLIMARVRSYLISFGRRAQ